MLDYLLNIIIEEYIRKNIKERKIGVYYVSELSMCLRKLYYFYKVGEKIDLSTFLLMESGRVMHEWLAEVLKSVNEIDVNGTKYRIEVSSEQKLSYQIGNVLIEGRYDNIITVKISDTKEEVMLIEVKTTADLDKIKEPKPEHIMQLNFYIGLVGLKEGYLLYIDRKNYRYKIFKIKYKKELFDQLVKRAIALHYSLVNNILPDREVGFRCKYCPFKNICLGGMNDRS